MKTNNLPSNITLFDLDVYCEETNKRQPKEKYTLAFNVQIGNRQQIMELDYIRRQDSVNALKQLEKNSKHMLGFLIRTAMTIINH